MRYNLKLDRRLNLPDDIKQKFWHMPIYVSFSGGVHEESARKFIETFEASEQAAIDAGQEILPVIIDSYGGSVYDCLGMVDSMRNCSLPIATIVESKAMSAGTVLFSCGTNGHRYVGPNATIMIHQVSSVMPSRQKVEDIKSNSNEVERLNDRMFEIISENCGKDADYFKSILHQKHRNSDWYLTPEEAVKHNLANHARIPSMEVNIQMNVKFG